VAWDGNYAHLDPAFALELIAGDRDDGNDEPRQLILHRFVQQGDRRPGFFTLLAGTGLALDQLPLPEPQAAPALARYLGWLKQRGAAGPGGGLFWRLPEFYRLAHPWQAGDPGVVQADEYARLLEYLRAGRSPALTWALASLVLEDRARHTAL